MLIEFEVSNYRSIREKLSLSMLSSNSLGGGGDPADNFYSHGKLDVLTTTVLYGRNASGKSNLIKAINVLVSLVTESSNFKHQDKIEYYRPFVFKKEPQADPTALGIEFLYESLRFKYEVQYDDRAILKEELFFFPKGKIARLFLREREKKIIYGSQFKGNRRVIEEDLLENQLFLSKSATSNIKFLKEAFLFFKTKIFSTSRPLTDLNQVLSKVFASTIFDNKIPHFEDNLVKILKSADTNISRLLVDKNETIDHPFPELLPSEMRDLMISKYKYDINTSHKVYDGEAEVGEAVLSLSEESLGTQQLLVIGSFILLALESGMVVVLDEFEKSLHPLVCKMLINLFRGKKNNPLGAQLVFSTHDISLLDNEIFRRDQVWFVDKNFSGATSVYRLSDFNGVRSSTPFDRWYLSGRFGGIPVIDPVELVLNASEGASGSKS